jgi:hypothetical protein
MITHKATVVAMENAVKSERRTERSFISQSAFALKVAFIVPLPEQLNGPSQS